MTSEMAYGMYEILHSPRKEKPHTKNRGFDLSGEAIFSEIPVLQGDFIPVRGGAAHLKRMRKVEAGSGF